MHKKAMEGSIKKWEAIVRGGQDDGIDNCPLCKLYFKNDCKRCNVYVYKERNYCRDTPYDAWRKHQEHNHTSKVLHADPPGDQYLIECNDCVPLAWAMLEFLNKVYKEQYENKDYKVYKEQYGNKD